MSSSILPSLPLSTQEAFSALYQLSGEEIGAGGSSGIMTVTGRPELVVKVSYVSAHWPADLIERTLNDLYNEFHCLKKAEGIKGIPKVHDYFVIPTDPSTGALYQLYLVLERVEVEPYQSLESLVDQGELDPQLVQELILPWLLRTVAELHDRNILYSDFQLMNTLIDTEGKPYLVDFGEACYVGPDTDQVPTAYNSRYNVVPEQEGVEGRFVITKASDVYRLGTLLKSLPWVPQAISEECRRLDPATRPDSARLRELAASRA